MEAAGEGSIVAVGMAGAGTFSCGVIQGEKLPPKIFQVGVEAYGTCWETGTALEFSPPCFPLWDFSP